MIGPFMPTYLNNIAAVHDSVPSTQTAVKLVIKQLAHDQSGHHGAMDAINMNIATT